MQPWSEYQETSATFFRELGMDASTNVSLQGVRTKHDIDVLVTFSHGGLDLTWVVECKRWKTKVSKVHVLALRQIVEDVGADRGILLAEHGFQSGAIEATEKSNVSVTNLLELHGSAADTLNRQRLLTFPLRIAQAHHDYWSISKTDRIELGIRTGMDDRGYLGQLVLGAAQDVLLSALADKYPPTGHYSGYQYAWKIENLSDALRWLDREVSELERRLATPEAISRRRLRE